MGIYVPGQIYFGPTSAETRVVLDETLTTIGPVRQGYLYIVADGIAYEGGGFTVDLSGGPSFLKNLFCGNCAIHAAPAFDFTLGQLFTVNFKGGAAWGSSPSQGGGYSSASVLFTVKFTELDGTSVDVMTTSPEPATWSIIGVSLGILTLLRKRMLLLQH